RENHFRLSLESFCYPKLSATSEASGSLDAIIRRYRLENGNSLGEKDELFGPPSAPVLENPEFQTRWYFKYFLGKMHQNYIGVDGAREPYLLSITCPELQKDVLLLEEQEGSVNFKIGVMIMKPGQRTDDEMLSNEKGNEKWDRFISLLGDRIRLRGWNRFRGGLDVKAKTDIFAVVSEVEGEGYRLSVYTDDTVPPFGPSLPCPPIFNDPQLFREFLLVKLMNGEKAAFQTPTFALKRQRTLDTLIRDIYAEHCSDHKVPMLSRRALSDVWSGGAAGGAGSVRTERFLHVGEGGKTLLAVAIGKRILLLLEETKTDSEMGFEYTHYKRLTSKGLESDCEYDFHWTTVPTAVVCAFPYIMAFAEDLLEIRLVANGSLVHAACIPGLKLLCGRKDIFYVACAPEYVPLSREIDPSLSLHDNYELVRQMSKMNAYSVEDDEHPEQKTDQAHLNRTPENNSGSSRSSSISSEQENIRPPLQRMTPISPPTSPQVIPENAGRCVRIYKIPQSNLSAATYQRQSVSTDQVVTSFFSDRQSSIRQKLADLRLDS
ncbi:unnamed protein product, partial [Leptidea sinapis]